MFIYCEIKHCDSPCEHVMTSSTFEGGHKTSVQAFDLELFISVQVHATSFCTNGAVGLRSVLHGESTCVGGGLGEHLHCIH